MILESFFSGVGTVALKELIDWARKKDEKRIRALLEAILNERGLNNPSQLTMTTHITNINVLVQYVLLHGDELEQLKPSPVLILPSLEVTDPGLAAASLGSDHVECFYRGPDNHLKHRWWWNGSPWSDEHDLGGILTSAPAAISRKSDHIECFYRGQDNQIWHRWWDGSHWEREYWLGGISTSAPAAASLGPDHVECFYRGPDNHLKHRWWWNGSGWWSDEHDLGGILTSAPAAIARKSDHIECFYRGPDNHLWHRWGNGSWDQEYWLGGLVT